MPTIKQKKAVERMVENGGNVSRAMRDVGYSKNTAVTPQKLTESNGFKELMEEYLPDNMLLRALHEDIDAKKQNRKAELELAFKLKGKMIDNQEIGNLQIIIPNVVAKSFNINGANKETE